MVDPKRLESGSVTEAILWIRGLRVILDETLASLYGVPTKSLIRAVKRNTSRFPPDFMFQLTTEEFDILRYQFGTSSSWGGRRHHPYAFTEHGVAMLSSVLRSDRAVQVNIEIMRAFVRLREILQVNRDLAAKLDALERRYDGQFRVVFDAIRALTRPNVKPTKSIGFRAEGEPPRGGNPIGP